MERTYAREHFEVLFFLLGSKHSPHAPYVTLPSLPAFLYISGLFPPPVGVHWGAPLLSSTGNSRQGACLTGSKGEGSYVELWGRTQAKCRDECVSRGIECKAYEYTQIRRYTKCELHKVSNTHPCIFSRHMPIPGFPSTR